MKNIKIVIGANYGDEGKGLMTDYFANESFISGKKTVVVCSNGGAQRGHTVRTPSNEKHVFHHFGSGTFTGADTYLPEPFIVNPMLFIREYREFTNKYGITDFVIYVNPECKISNPFDMFANQFIELIRNDNKHGSVGLGIWETEVRYRNTEFNKTVYNYINMPYNEQFNYLKNCRDYVIKRISEETGVDIINYSHSNVDFMFSDDIIENYIRDTIEFREHTCFAYDGILSKYDTIIFENGQGLALDKQYTNNDIKYTTPSNTGIVNPIKIINNFTCEANIEVCYVTRSYITRHGTGPFEEECDFREINPYIVDNTNVYNDYQGSIRYGKLNVDNMLYRIMCDYSSRSSHFGTYNWTKSLAVTHINEYKVSISRNGFKKVYLSDTETRESVKQI